MSAVEEQTNLLTKIAEIFTALINTRNSAESDKKAAEAKLQAVLDQNAADEAVIVANNAQLQALLDAATQAQPGEVEPTTPEAI